MEKLGVIDLSNCDREPIHIPGAIQPHGVLVVCRVPGLAITHVSANSGAILGIESQNLLGSPIGSLFPIDDAQGRQDTLIRDVVDEKPVYLFTVRTRGTSATFDAIAHRCGDLIFIEFEAAFGDRSLSAPELYRMVQRSMVKLQRPMSVEEMCRSCAQQVREISGFDRAMLYRFDAEWNGQIVAEDRREDLEPFLGLHYPASDIPRQARELYTKNWLRFIADCGYTPSPILSLAGAESETPLDMSFSVLRSVSPIHIEYLQNMGVAASMSVSLIRDGRLWGLVACHHYSPRFVPYDTRTACELLGQMMSLHLDGAEQREIAQDRAGMLRVEDALLASIDQFDDTTKALIESEPNVLALIQANGAAAVVGDRITRIGQTPGDEDIRRLAALIVQKIDGELFATDHLRNFYGSDILLSVASGVLAVCITASPLNVLLWFRTEQIRTVEWAGDPAKTIMKGDGAARLSPRGSFALWKETIKGRSKPWKPSELEIAQRLHDGIVRKLLYRTERLTLAHTDLRLASEEREKLLNTERSARAEAERMSGMKDEFVATLSHELRTPLNAILGWAQILGRTPGLDEELAEGIQIIDRNARSQSRMIEDLLEITRIVSGKLRLDLQHTHLPSVVDAAIDTVTPAALAKDIRIEKLLDPLIGLETTGDPGRLQQVVWNLLSNAVKFTPKGGRVFVELKAVDSHVELTISDNGQGIKPDFLPYVFERFRQADASAGRRHGGLGLGLSIVRNLIELHGGTVRAQSGGEGKGATFIVSLPVRAIRATADELTADAHTFAPSEQYPQLNLAGVKVLVVDDEPDARHLLTRLLTSCHCAVTAASCKIDAIAALKAESFDVIVSDIGMPDGDGFELIRELRQTETQTGVSKTPAIALTAYARPEDRRRVILAGYQAHVDKPVEAGELLVLIASLAGRVE